VFKGSPLTEKELSEKLYQPFTLFRELAEVPFAFSFLFILLICC